VTEYTIENYLIAKLKGELLYGGLATLHSTGKLPITRFRGHPYDPNPLFEVFKNDRCETYEEWKSRMENK
jgi:hypothetical protein